MYIYIIFDNFTFCTRVLHHNHKARSRMFYRRIFLSGAFLYPLKHTSSYVDCIQSELRMLLTILVSSYGVKLKGIPLNSTVFFEITPCSPLKHC
jgi:hypothetical protein